MRKKHYRLHSMGLLSKSTKYTGLINNSPEVLHRKIVKFELYILIVCKKFYF